MGGSGSGGSGSGGSGWWGGGPCLFSEVGKKAKDVLGKGLSTGHAALFVSHLTSAGATLWTAPVLAPGGLVVATAAASLAPAPGVKADVSVAVPTNQICAETTYEDLVPGLKVSLSTALPGAARLGKAELVLRRRAAALTATVRGLRTTPTLELSANVGSDKLSAGASAVYDSHARAVSGLVAGIGYVAAPVSWALVWNVPEPESSAGKSRGAVTVYYAHDVGANLSVAASAGYERETRATSASLAGLLRLDPRTSVKAKMSSSGSLSALLEYEPKPLVTIGLSAEFPDAAKLLLSSPSPPPKLGLNVTVLSV